MSEKEQNDLKVKERELQLKLVAIRLKSNLDRNLKQAKKNGEICRDFEREHFIKEDAMRRFLITTQHHTLIQEKLMKLSEEIDAFTIGDKEYNVCRIQHAIPFVRFLNKIAPPKNNVEENTQFWGEVDRELSRIEEKIQLATKYVEETRKTVLAGVNFLQNELKDLDVSLLDMSEINCQEYARSLNDADM